MVRGCILSKFYIKPQLSNEADDLWPVVSYRNSTSNHNWFWCCSLLVPLYLIEILHQTTTPARIRRFSDCCILSKFYIKPQLLCFPRVAIHRCILSKFYIKPQLRKMLYTFAESCILSKFYIKPQHLQAARTACKVVSYRNSTSNHNHRCRTTCHSRLYLIEILHQTTTMA